MTTPDPHAPSPSPYPHTPPPSPYPYAVPHGEQPPPPLPYPHTALHGQPQPQPAAYPYQQPPFASPEAHYPTAANGNQLALTSLICGIVAMLCCGLFTGIPAIITGFMARRQIAASAGAQSGQTQALWGIILGAVATVFTLIAAAIWLVVVLASSSTPTPHYTY